MVMQYIPEAQSSAVVTHEMAFEAISEAFKAAGVQGAVVFPALIAHGSDPGNRFSVKSGATQTLAGLKMGFIWPGNTSKGLPTHNSVTVLFNQETGGVRAVIESGVVNAYRTAAADAVATNQLARKDAKTLAAFGAGNQAGYDCIAIARIRPIEKVLVVNADPMRAERFAQRLAAHGLTVELTSAQDACARADIIVTATPAKTPLFDADWIRPGTHISCMGADGIGKQELPTELYRRARLFCDLAAQSVVIGEFQHAAALIQAGTVSLTQIGRVLSGEALGRQDAQAITIFDSSGIALQDLYIAERLLSACPLSA
jgi:ornithine cyclodeaminase